MCVGVNTRDKNMSKGKTYVERVIDVDVVLELSGEVAERAGHESEEDSRGCYSKQK